MTRRLSAILLGLALASMPQMASAVFERSVLQYTHQRWSEESDAPKPVFALAQDKRGFIWVATGRGLFRFDGLRFEAIPGVDPVIHGPPSAVLVRRNGEVWTNFERSRRFAVYRDGRLQLLSASPAPHRIAVMQETADGTLWAMSERIGVPLLRYRNGLWTTFDTVSGVPLDNPFSMVLTRDGAVWLSFTQSVMRLPPGGERLELVRKTPGALGRLSVDPEDRVWLSERRGSYPISGPGGRGAPPALRHPYLTDSAQIRGWPMFDRRGNLWMATYYDGLQRIARPDPRGAATPAEARSRVERFTLRDGLTSDATTQMIEDAEGNVWLATENGLDRFWPASVRFEPAFTQTAAFGDLLLAARDGSVYVGQARTVYRIRTGSQPEAIFRTTTAEPRTLCEAPDGAIWIGTDDETVTIWREGQVSRLPGKIPVQDTIYDCAFDARGDYWVTAARGGMARFQRGRWERMFGPTGDTFQPRSMVTDNRGRLTVQWNERTLVQFEGDRRLTTAIPFGVYQPYDVALYSGSGGNLFVAGRFGVARLRAGRFLSLTAQQVPLFSEVNGMVETPDGDSWLAGPAGLLRIATRHLDSAFDQPDRLMPMQVFGTADGLRNRPHDHSRKALVRGGDGRLWIATQTGTQWLDPQDVARSDGAPPVAITALSADRFYRDPTRLRLPAGTTDIEIDFAVPSFANPRNLRVRYQVEGQDPHWVEAGMRRQAFYTNLAPGTYRFRVIAANGDGVWNLQGASVEFEIPPTFSQTRWFLALCLLAASLAIWGIVRWRYAEAARRLRNRLEERVSERERIARDLHDTLLQSVQGLVLTFQAASDRMPKDNGERERLQSALEQADDVILEGRERVRALRGHADAADLPRVMRELTKISPFDPSVAVTVTVTNRPVPVDPYVVSELALIGGEALFNIARHAQAKRVDISLSFDRPSLTVQFSDDGIGIPANVIGNGGRDGHFGLMGMRERTERIGGLFSIESTAETGTTIEVTLAARIAYRRTRKPGCLALLRRRFKAPPTA